MSTTAAANKNEKEEGDAGVPAVKTERVPDSFIQFLKKKPFRRLRPLPDSAVARNPGLLETFLPFRKVADAIMDIQEDILRQDALKGYAEVGVEFMEDGRKRIFVLPQHDRPPLLD